MSALQAEPPSALHTRARGLPQGPHMQLATLAQGPNAA